MLTCRTIDALRAPASTAQPAPAAGYAEPVAWLHDDPQRYDVSTPRSKTYSEMATLRIHRPGKSCALHDPTRQDYDLPRPSSKALPREDSRGWWCKKPAKPSQQMKMIQSAFASFGATLKSAVLAAFLREDAAAWTRKGDQHG